MAFYSKEWNTHKDIKTDISSPPITAIERGLRRSVPLPMPIAKGKKPKISASIVINIGRSRSRAARKTDEGPGDDAAAPLICLDLAKIRIALFVEIAKTKRIPINAVLSSSIPAINKAASAPAAESAIAVIDAIAARWLAN